MNTNAIIMRARRAALTASLAIALAAPHADAQGRAINASGNENPVYIADSPIASDALQRVRELLTQGNLDEGVRLCDEIIRLHGQRLIIADPDDPDRVHIPVRRHVNAFIRAEPALLEAYRRQMTPRARAMLADERDWARAAREAWLTEPGLVASLRQAQTLVESGNFHAGLALLSECRTHPDADAHRARIQRLESLASALVERTPLAFTPQSTGRSLVWDAIPQDPASLEGIFPGVLAIAELTPTNRLESTADPTPTRPGGTSWKPTAWCTPLLDGQHLYTNDGYTISCFDRFTLRPIWRVQTIPPDTEIPTTPDERARIGRLVEDSTSISSDGHGALYVSAGIPRGGESNINARLLKLDRESGRVIWRADLETMDPALQGASIRGPVVIDNGTVVVTARTSNRRQRLVSLSVVGIDAATGRLRWVQPIASAGSLPFQQMGQLAHSPIVRDGVYYLTDTIGLGAAIRIATGEVLWARPLPPPDLYARSTRPSFAGNSPAINSHGLFVLTSDGSRILRLDPGTGHTLGSRPAERIGEALYLLGVRDDLFLCVNTDRVIFYQADRFETSNPRRSPVLGDESGQDTGILGRVVVMGSRVLVPVEGGVRVIDPQRIDEGVFYRLNATGNIAVSDGQIIVVDQLKASCFLSWETASRMLERRIGDDPGASITLAELAYRTGRIDEIAPSVQRALSIVRAQPIDRRGPLRDALFEVVLDMVRTDRDDDQTGAFLDRMGEQRVGVLMRTLGELARTHEQAVAHRMELGAVHERHGRSSEAIAAYQDVLDEPPLRGAMWEGADIAVRAGLEASRRIGEIIKREGFSAYEHADNRALTELGYLGDDSDTTRYLELAQRYPWSRGTPRMMLLAARASMRAKNTPGAVDAARKGIEIYERLETLGMTLGLEDLEGLSEHLITGLISMNRAREAYNAAQTLKQRHGSLTLRHDGREISIDQLQRAAGRTVALPALGEKFINDPNPLLVTGSPLRPAHRYDSGGVLVYAPQLARLRYLRAGRNVFETFWERPAPGDQPPMIVWQGPDRVLVFWPESAAGDTGTLEAIETTTGQVAWSIDSLRVRLESGSDRVTDDEARINTLIPVPTLGSLPVGQLIVVCDGRSVVVSDRIGRAMAVDLFTGQPLWQRDLPATRVHDLDLADGLLGVCGMVVLDRAKEQRNGSMTPVVAGIDARSGEPTQINVRFGHNPRWVRVGDSKQLFVAGTQWITALDLETGLIKWVVHDETVYESRYAWVTDTHLIILSNQGRLWTLDRQAGSRSRKPVETRGRITPRGWIRLMPEIGRTVLLSNMGFASFDPETEVVAMDARHDPEGLVDIAWGQSRAVMVGQARLEDGNIRCTLSLIDHENGRMLDRTTLSVPASLGRQPINAVAVNGGVLVGFGEVSLLVRVAD